MMTRIRWPWWLLLAVLATGIGSIASAQCAMRAQAAADPTAATGTPAPPAMMNPHGGCGPMAMKMMDPMGLSEDQQKAIQKIRTDGQDAMMSARKEMMRLRNAMQGEMLKDELDAGAVRKLAQKMGDLRTQMQLRRLEQRLAIRQLLTPEQRDRAMLRHGRGGACCPGGMRGTRGMHRMMGHGGGMGGPGAGPMGGPGCCGMMSGAAGGPGCGGMLCGAAGGPGCAGMGGPGKGCTPGPGCGHMQAPPQGKGSSALPEGGALELGAGFPPDPDLDLMAEFDLGFDEGFDEMVAPAAPEPPLEPMTP